MGMNIIYNGFDFKEKGLSVPLLSVDSNFDFTNGGALIGETVNISLRGQIRDTGSLPFNDSGNINKPNMPTNWQTLQEYVTGLQKAFSEDYKKLEIKCSEQPLFTSLFDTDQETLKVNRIDFSNRTDDNLVQFIDYDIDLQIERSNKEQYAGLTDIYVSSIENTYTITPSQKISEYLPESGATSYFPSGNSIIEYSVKRTIGAVGKATKNVSAIDNAKKCVTGLLYRDMDFFRVLDNLSIRDRSTLIDADSINGSYSISDTFSSYKTSSNNIPLHTETFNITSSLEDNFNRNITINGTIQGLKTLPNTNSGLYWDYLQNSELFFETNNHTGDIAYYNASGAFYSLVNSNAFYTRLIQTVFPSGFLNTDYDGLTFFSSTNNIFNGRTKWINPDPATIEIEHKPVEGSIDYTFQYNSRPLNLFPNSITEEIGISDTYATRIKPSQTVYRRMPIIQDLATYNLPTRTVTYNVTFPVTGISLTHVPAGIRSQMNTLINKFNPNSTLSQPLGPARIVSWITVNRESNDPINGSFKKTITWAYEVQAP